MIFLKGNHCRLAILSLSLVACKTVRNTSSEKLINGTPGTTADFPGAVGFMKAPDEELPTGDFCSGTKIAPRAFLTAAHCIDAFMSQDGAPVTPPPDISFRLPDGERFGPLRVDRIAIHPNYRGTATSGLSGPDVALIFVKSETPAIAVVPLMEKSIAAGTEIIVTGYGCEEGRDGDEEIGGNPFKFGQRKVLGLDEIRRNLDNSTFSKMDAKSFEVFNKTFYTYEGPLGLSGDRSVPGGCPGDSGSGIYTETPQGKAVVAVVSWGVYKYVNTTDPTKLPALGNVTRLQDEGRYTVLTWIKSELAGTSYTSPYIVEDQPFFSDDDPSLNFEGGQEGTSLPRKISTLKLEVFGFETWRNSPEEARNACPFAVKAVYAKEVGKPAFERLLDRGAGRFSFSDGTIRNVDAVKVETDATRVVNRCVFALSGQ